MKREIDIRTKGMKVHAQVLQNEHQWIMSTTIKRWVRKLEYTLTFIAEESLKQELKKTTDFNNWRPLELTRIHRLENLAWKSLGFQRLYTLQDIPQLKGIKAYHNVKLLGLEQSETRTATELTDIWIGERQGHQFALMHVGHYFSAGFSNMQGSSPTTMVFPLEIIKHLLDSIA
jgi:hypothetical protein